MISIIIPSYNRAHLIGETLDSVLAQTYQNWECIIIDDHSEDDTEAVVAKYVKEDKRFSFFKKPKKLPKGPSASRNYGFTKSKGEFINWLDSDDLMHPQKLEIDLKNIQSGDYDFTISQSEFFTDDGTCPTKKFWNKNLWSDDPINDFILMKIGWSTNAPLWKRKSLIKYSLKFNSDLITADDYFYHIQALFYGFKPVISNIILIKQRQHPNRLNEFKFKASFKLKVNFYLMKNRFGLELNKKTLVFLNNQFTSQLSNMIKHKKYIMGLSYYLRTFKLGYKIKTHFKSYKLFVFGLFYQLFNKGYKFLD
ncbi:MAG: glycosyltransferase family 2 protein [Psychroflexus halocasei]